MYKINPFLLLCSLFLFLASCDGEPEKHELTPVEQPIILYADQTVDSLLFYTYDSWTVTPQVDWISVDGKSHVEIKNDYRIPYLCRVFVKVKPNATGRTRTGTLLVQSYEYAYSSPLVQLGLLRVSHPEMTVDSWLDEQARIPDVAHYEMTGEANWTSDYLSFTVQDNWDLVFADATPPTWISFDRATGLPGQYKVNITMEENTDTENGREATLRLSTGEVSNTITIRQLPAKK